jgi:hypothetical protein
MKFFEHVAEQYPPELKKKKYEYWNKLRDANADFRRDNHFDDHKDELLKFQQWMLDQWGMRIGTESQGYSPYFEIVDERKYLLFELKYADRKY